MHTTQVFWDVHLSFSAASEPLVSAQLVTYPAASRLDVLLISVDHLSALKRALLQGSLSHIYGFRWFQ